MDLYTKRFSQAGDNLFILHGLFGNQANWATHAKQFGERFSVLAMDMRNHGRSDWVDRMSYPLMASDVRETMRCHGIPRGHFLGHSMGGKVAMALALACPGLVRKLVVVDIAPVGYTPHHQKIFAGFREMDLDYIDNRHEADEVLSEYVAEKPVRDFLLTNLQRDGDGNLSWRINVKAIMANYEELLAGVDADQPFTGEVLFIRGGNSNYVLPEHEDTIKCLFPNSTITTIDNAGHWVHSEQPEKFQAIVNDFLG